MREHDLRLTSSTARSRSWSTTSSLSTRGIAGVNSHFAGPDGAACSLSPPIWRVARFSLKKSTLPLSQVLAIVPTGVVGRRTRVENPLAWVLPLKSFVSKAFHPQLAPTSGFPRGPLAREEIIRTLSRCVDHLHEHRGSFRGVLLLLCGRRADLRVRGRIPIVIPPKSVTVEKLVSGSTSSCR
jgi:hypothetical protein